MLPVYQAPKTEPGIHRVLKLPREHRDAWFAKLTDRDALALRYAWRELWARPDQLEPPGDWMYWLANGGRGGGKTRLGAEWTIEQAKKQRPHGALVGATSNDVTQTMIEGPSGIMKCSPPDFMPSHNPSKMTLVWPNGVKARLFTADAPERLRGANHGWGWLDEFAAWRRPEAWDQFKFGLRLGKKPRAVITTTPRPKSFVRALMADPDCVVTHCSSYANRANLSDAWFEQVIKKYEGTALGRQEIYAEIMDEMPGALWKRATLEQNRRPWFDGVKTFMRRLAIAVDPAVSATEGSDETGIMVCGLGQDKHGYLIDDLSGVLSPDDWGMRVVLAYLQWDADVIVAEKNNGGDLVKQNILVAAAALSRERGVRIEVNVELVHASRGKHARAEPIAALYAQGMIHHLGMFPGLEDQQTNWVSGEEDSPDRIDAMVWGFSRLMLGVQPEAIAINPDTNLRSDADSWVSEREDDGLMMREEW